MCKYFPMLLLMFSISAVANPLADQLTWNYEFSKSKEIYWLEKLVTYSTPKGNKTGGVAVAYDNKNQKPIFITVWGIKGLPINSEILVSFFDSVQVNGEWKLKASEDGFISIPIMECDNESCFAKVYPEISVSDHSTLNLFEELKKRRFMLVLFKLDGEEYSYMVPVSGINQALEKIKK